MISSYVTYQAQLARVDELHRESAARRLASEMEERHGAGVRLVVMRRLKARVARSHSYPLARRPGLRSPDGADLR